MGLFGSRTARTETVLGIENRAGMMFTMESSGMARKDLDNVAKAAGKVTKAREELRQAILAAHQSGEVIRDIAEVAKISPTQVHSLIREARSESNPTP